MIMISCIYIGPGDLRALYVSLVRLDVRFVSLRIYVVVNVVMRKNEAALFIHWRVPCIGDLSEMMYKWSGSQL